MFTPSTSGSSDGVAARPADVAGAIIPLGAGPSFQSAWWLDPARAILFLIVPIFCLASYSNHSNYWTFKLGEDFVTNRTFGLGLYSAGAMILGVLIAKLSKRRQDVVSLIDREQAFRVLTVLSWITILAYLMLFGTLAVNFDLVIALVRGSPEAASELKDSLGRIPGLTSFVQFGIVDLALASGLVVLGGVTLPKRLRFLVWTVFALTFLRSILNSERLALLEALSAMFIVRIAFKWRPSPWKVCAPYAGIVLVFLAFAAGEYFRSWQFYRPYYTSYLEFALTRFGGYFSTSINNGAGQYTIFAQKAPTPEVTVGWITKFPGLSGFFDKSYISVHDQFLITYANPEFNSPGGLYGAFLDWRFPVATLFMIGLGFATGWIHRSFENKEVFGIMMYPVAFLGLTDLIRIVYLSDTRTLPMFLGTIAAVVALKPVTGLRSRLLNYHSDIPIGGGAPVRVAEPA